MGSKSRNHWAPGAKVDEDKWNDIFPFIYFYRREGEWCIKKNGTDITNSCNGIQIIKNTNKIYLYMNDDSIETYSKFKIDIILKDVECNNNWAKTEDKIINKYIYSESKNNVPRSCVYVALVNCF